MIILGILFLAAAAVAAVELIVANNANDGQVTLHMWRWAWQLDAFWLAVIGAAILFVALLGLGLLKSSGRRARRVRRERKDLTVQNRLLSERADVAEAKHAAPTNGHARPATTAPPVATQPAPNGYVTPDGQDATTQHAEQRG